MIFPSSLGARIVDSDGRPLPIEEFSDTIEVYPGERYGVLVESSVPILDLGSRYYFDMMTSELKNVQHVKVDIRVPNQVEEFENVIDFSIAPNPVDQDVRISFDLLKETNLSLRIVSIDGKLMLSEFPRVYEQGKHTLVLSTNEYARGQSIKRFLNGNNVTLNRL